MKVIKAVKVSDTKLVSTFARDKWKKKYIQGVETTPDVGCLFAYSRRNIRQARKDMGINPNIQFWYAEAEVVGKVKDASIDVFSERWSDFWNMLKLRLQCKGAEYLLCSSITLTKKL